MIRGLIATGGGYFEDVMPVSVYGIFRLVKMQKYMRNRVSDQIGSNHGSSVTKKIKITIEKKVYIE